MICNRLRILYQCLLTSHPLIFIYLVVRIQRIVITLSARKSLFWYWSDKSRFQAFSASPVFFAPSLEMATFFQSV